MKVTKNFSLEEFRCHDAAHTPYPREWLERLRRLCKTLEAIRAEIGAPIRILSGYRTPQWNRKVGGARDSQHVNGVAADITIAGMVPGGLHYVILTLYAEGKLPHLGGLGLYEAGGFVHVDVRVPVGNRLARWSGKRAKAEVTG